jgi:hypothetical protein
MMKRLVRLNGKERRGWGDFEVHMETDCFTWMH